MVLTKDNLKEWKECLSKEFKEQQDIDDFADTNWDHYWLKNHIGEDTQDIIDAEIECWD